MLAVDAAESHVVDRIAAFKWMSAQIEASGGSVAEPRAFSSAVAALMSLEAIAQSFGNVVAPALVMIDAAGIIRWIEAGVPDFDRLEAELLALMT